MRGRRGSLLRLYRCDPVDEVPRSEVLAAPLAEREYLSASVVVLDFYRSTLYFLTPATDHVMCRGVTPLSIFSTPKRNESAIGGVADLDPGASSARSPSTKGWATSAPPRSTTSTTASPWNVASPGREVVALAGAFGWRSHHEYIRQSIVALSWISSIRDGSNRNHIRGYGADPELPGEAGVRPDDGRPGPRR